MLPFRNIDVYIYIEYQLNQIMAGKQTFPVAPNSRDRTTFSDEKNKPSGEALGIALDRMIAGRSLAKQVCFAWIARLVLPGANDYFWTMYQSYKYEWGKELLLFELLKNIVLEIVGCFFVILYIGAVVKYFYYYAESIFPDLGCFKRLPLKRTIILLATNILFYFFMFRGDEMKQLAIPFYVCQMGVNSFLGTHLTFFLISELSKYANKKVNQNGTNNERNSKSKESNSKGSLRAT